jgi:hypothetical protein
MGHHAKSAELMPRVCFSIAAGVKPRPSCSGPSCAPADDAARGSGFSSRSAPRRLMMGSEGWGGTIFGAPLPRVSSRIGRPYELTSPVVPVRTFFCRSRTRYLLAGNFSVAGSGNRRNRGAVLAPAELATVDPHPVQNHGQAPGDRNDGATDPAPLGHPHTPSLQPRPFPALDKQ